MSVAAKPPWWGCYARSGGGKTWQAMRDGLPQEACYFTVLRQAMARDEREPVGLYFGTNSGSVFASLDERESWHEIARHLPANHFAESKFLI